MPATSARAARGRRGEALAATFLAARGYRLVARNHRCAGGEIDLVAWDGAVLCFVEVRSRAESSPVGGLETIGRQKRRRLVRAAADYVEAVPHPWPPMRFDALGVVLSDPPAFTLVADAFQTHDQ